MLPLNITPLTSPGICFAGIMLRLWLCYGQRGASRWIRQGNALLLWSCIMSQTHVLKETSFWRQQLSFSLELLCTSADTAWLCKSCQSKFGSTRNGLVEVDIITPGTYFSRNVESSTSWEFCSKFGLSLLAHGVPDAQSLHLVIYTEVSWYQLCADKRGLAGTCNKLSLPS
jgi:hypothetical protein